MLKEVNQMTDQEFVQMASELTADEKRAIKEALASLWPLYEEGKVPGAVIAQLGALVGYPAPEGYPQPYKSPASAYPHPAQKSDLEDLKQMLSEVVDREEMKQELTKALEGVEKAWAEKEKALTEALQKAEARLAELEKALQQEQEEKERLAVLSELREKFPQIANSAPQLLEELVNIRKSEMFDAMIKLVSMVEGMLKQAPLLKEIGERGQDGDPFAELDREARALVEKGEATTLEKARVKVLERRPDLYKALRGGA